MAYDLLIRNGTVVDGTGAPGRPADVAVTAGRIAEIGRLTGGAGRVIDAAGAVIAPCRPQAREIAMRDLVNVEGIPFEVLERGITWEWRSFPEFLEAAARRRPALNLGFLAPLTPFRHEVMGEASMERAASAQETAQIKALLREALAAGALGFS